MKNRFDCLIVGAGPAGLAAGEIMHAAGADFAVLEAADEIGGRAKSLVLQDGSVFERGAMLMHGHRVLTWEAVLRHGLTPHGTYHHEWFTPHCVADDVWTETPDDGDYSASLALLETMLFDPANEGRSLFEVVTRCPCADVDREQMLEEFAGLIPLDPREVDARSAGDMLRRESPTTTLYELVEGYSELWRRMAQPFRGRVRLDSPVTSIRYSPDGVEVTAGGTTLRAASVIVTPSVGVLQSGAIEFEPALPQRKTEAIAGLRMAPMMKIAAFFRNAFWEGAIGEALSFAVPSAVHFGAWYVLNAQRGGPPMLVALYGSGSEALTGDCATIESAVRRDLETAFGADVLRAELVEILVEDWPSNPLAYGAVSAVPVGRRHLRAALAEPTPPVFWAGEGAATDGHAECVEGAIATGRTAAVEALHCSRPMKAGRPDSRLDWSLARN